MDGSDLGLHITTVSLEHIEPLHVHGSNMYDCHCI